MDAHPSLQPRPSLPESSASLATPASLSAERKPELDLTGPSVAKHWRDLGVHGIIAAMESCEPWAVDARRELSAEVERVIKQVCDAFNSADANTITGSVRKSPELVIELMGFLRSGRGLALFTWLSNVEAGLAPELINEARSGRDEFGRILVDRIVALERQRLLSRVFSPERIALVLELLDEAGLTDE